MNLRYALNAILAIAFVSVVLLALRQGADLAESRKQQAKAAADVRHFKGKAYWLEERYEDAVQGMRDEHSVDMWRLVQQLQTCEVKK